MTISVIIPTCGRPQLLEQAVESVRAQTHEPLEIIVVPDDARTRGPAGARNDGARRATGDVFVFLDDDCIAEPQWLEKITAGFKHDEIVAVSGAVIYRMDGHQPALHERAVHNPEAKWFMGANCAVRRDAFERVGGFPEDYRVYEDKALALKLWRIGVIERAPAARVYHQESVWTAHMVDRFADHLSYWVQLGRDFDVWTDRNNPPPILMRHIVMPRDFASMVKLATRVRNPYARLKLKLLVRQRLQLWKRAWEEKILFV